jgi:hypothetical protein
MRAPGQERPFRKAVWIESPTRSADAKRASPVVQSNNEIHISSIIATIALRLFTLGRAVRG